MFPEIRRFLLKRFMPSESHLQSLDLKTNNFDFTASDTELVRRAFGSGWSTYSGESVTRETALTHTVVWAAYRLVCDTMGRIPAQVMIKDKTGKSAALDHPMYRAMHDEPNGEISARGFRSMLTGHCVLEGDAFAKIIRRSGTGVALELEHLLPEQVSIEREKQGQKRLVYSVLNEFGGKDGTYVLEKGKPHDILHIRGLSWNGINGHNILRIGRQAIGTALAQDHNVGRFWRRGGRKPAHIEVERNPFPTKDDLEAYRQEFDKLWSDPHRVPFVLHGMKLESEGFTMAEAQALESRKWTVSDLARLLGVSPHLIGDLERATFSNIEQLFLEFKTITMAGWANLWEQDWNRCVLTPEEKTKGYFLHHNLNAFLIGDFAARMAGYASAKQNGWMNADEIRDLEDRNPLPDGAGQTYSIQLNMQTVPGTGAPTAAEQRLAQGNQPKKPSA